MLIGFFSTIAIISYRVIDQSITDGIIFPDTSIKQSTRHTNQDAFLDSDRKRVSKKNVYQPDLISIVQTRIGSHTNTAHSSPGHGQTLIVAPYVPVD